MKIIPTFIAMAALTVTASATSLGEKNHEVSSANGKFKLHVDVDTHIHKITGEFPAGDKGWQFEHDAQFHKVFLSDNGRVAAVVHWAWCQKDELNSPAVVIYDRMAEKFSAAVVKDGKEILATGFRPGVKKSYTYKQLSKPRERKPDEIGPIGDFWRVWWDKATMKGNILTINVEGAAPVVIDVLNPPDLPAHQSANKADDDAKVWAKAEAKMEGHLKGIDPKMRYAEFKSDLLRKYLPEFRVFVGFERNTIGDKELFLVNQNAEITDFESSDTSGISEFMRARKIQVETPEDAIEFVKFFGELQGAHWYISGMHKDTKEFTVFDKQQIEESSGPKSDWKHTSEKRKGGWKVKFSYVGDTQASIITPPIYEVDIDEDGNFRELRKIDDFTR